MPPITKILQQQKNLKQKQKSRLKFSNILCFSVLILCLVSYALIINACTGNKLEIQKTEKEKEVLRTKISEEISFLNILKIPTYIQAEIGNQMIKVKKVSYLKDKQTEVAILQTK